MSPYRSDTRARDSHNVQSEFRVVGRRNRLDNRRPLFCPPLRTATGGGDWLDPRSDKKPRKQLTKRLAAWIHDILCCIVKGELRGPTNVAGGPRIVGKEDRSLWVKTACRKS